MNNNTFVHKYIKGLINQNDIVTDMTVGNGNDTLFLVKKCKFVYGFDISLDAINNTKDRLKEYDNYLLIHDNHINVDKYIKEKIKLFIFNLGYLPYSDSKTITKANETLIAFKKSYDLLINNGYIIITFYLGHEGGKDEYYLIDNYIKKNNLKVLEIYKQDKINSPITYIIKKSV